MNCMYNIIKFAPNNTLYTDKTRIFPNQFSLGNNYVMVWYNYDANRILAESLKNRESNSLAEIWKIPHKHLAQNGHTTETYTLDNKIFHSSK